MTTRTCEAWIRRAGRLARCFDFVRPFQWIIYGGLIIWSFYSVIFTPPSPVARFMPGSVQVAYIALQAIGPCVCFYGQWIQHRHPTNQKMIENGWLVQAGAEASIAWTLYVAITAFGQAGGDAVMVAWFLAVFALCAVCRTYRDLVGAVEIHYNRCRARKAAACEL